MGWGWGGVERGGTGYVVVEFYYTEVKQGRVPEDTGAEHHSPQCPVLPGSATNELGDQARSGVSLFFVSLSMEKGGIAICTLIFHRI